MLRHAKVNLHVAMMHAQVMGALPPRAVSRYHSLTVLFIMQFGMVLIQKQFLAIMFCFHHFR